MSACTRMLTAALLVTTLGCSKNRDLRGYWEASSDGKTYLVVDDDNGGKCGPMHVDGKKWDPPIGGPGIIAPGVHVIVCGPPSNRPDVEDGIRFSIPNGVIYHFNYWGP